MNTTTTTTTRRARTPWPEPELATLRELHSTLADDKAAAELDALLARIRATTQRLLNGPRTTRRALLQLIEAAEPAGIFTKQLEQALPHCSRSALLSHLSTLRLERTIYRRKSGTSAAFHISAASRDAAQLADPQNTPRTATLRDCPRTITMRRVTRVLEVVEQAGAAGIDLAGMGRQIIANRQQLNLCACALNRAGKIFKAGTRLARQFFARQEWADACEAQRLAAGREMKAKKLDSSSREHAALPRTPPAARPPVDAEAIVPPGLQVQHIPHYNHEDRFKPTEPITNGFASLGIGHYYNEPRTRTAGVPPVAAADKGSKKKKGRK